MEQTTIRRPRRTQEEIKDLLSEFEKSNLSVIEFCNGHKIGRAAFHKWRTRYGSMHKDESAFTELQVASIHDRLSVSLFAEVGALKIYQPVSAAYLKELIR